MGCTSCSGGGCAPKGCKSNGGCSTGGCNRLNVFDWLSDLDVPRSEQFNIVEVRFKGGRKEFFRNKEQLSLTTGDPVIVEAASGYHIGYVSLKGELVRLQMRKKKVEDSQEIKDIQRLASSPETEKLAQVRELEPTAMYRARQIIGQLNLKMKLSDVEYQADKTKAIFYYSSEDRVDFRELIKRLADEFKVRIEMRQISMRHEAGRLGGIGSCGRELCCSTWLTDFKSVSTSAARYQNLSLNPSKLSGQCGRLKCCLNYELETYMDALKDIPSVSRPLLTTVGEAMLQKTDIFKKMMWFGYRGDNTWYPVPVARVKEIMELNAKGEKPDVLVPEVKEEKKKIEFEDRLEGDIEAMAEKYKTKAKKRSKKKKSGSPDTTLIAGSAPSEVPVASSPDQPRTERPPRDKQAGRNANIPGRENRRPRPERSEQKEAAPNQKPPRENRPPRPAPNADASGTEQPKGEGNAERTRNRNRNRNRNRGNRPDGERPSAPAPPTA